MAIEIPTGAERDYLIAFGVAAIYVASRGAHDASPCEIGVTRDLGRSLAAMRKRRPHTEIDYAVWLKDRKTANVIFGEMQFSIWWWVENAVKTIAAIADDERIVLTDHEATMMRVRAAVAEINERISQANDRGELAWFNRAYRCWRLEAKKVGRGMSYVEARARLRKAATKQLIVLGENDLGPAMLTQVFPPLSLLSQEKSA